MNKVWLKLQLSLCGLLLVGWLVEWTYDRLSSDRLQQALAQPQPSDFQAEDLPELEMLELDMDSVVERPLFIEGRKPIPEVVENPSQPTVDIGQIDDWPLIGIYNKGKQTLALFRKQNEARKYLKVSEQQMIAGWQLQQIQSDRVVLMQNGQSKTVMLRKPRPQLKPTAPNVPKNKPPAPQQPASMQPAAPKTNIEPSPETNNDESE
jgi:type II secretory pathway component PulC